MENGSIKNQGQEIRSLILAHIPSHPKDIVAVTAREFDVSRTTVHRHLMQLFRDREIVKTGDTRRATYYLKESRDKNFSFKKYKESISKKVGNISSWPCQYEIYKTIGESQ